VRSVNVDLEGAPVLRNVELTVAAGEFVVLLGENGSGKTTLLKALLGLVPLRDGSIDVHGTPVQRFREWRRVAYVPQRLLAATAVPVSVEEAVLAARITPRRRLRPGRAAARDAAREAMTVMGLWSRRHDRLDSLSGGQQRRAMVARALATGASTLLLDEPSAGVDADSELRMADALADLHAAGRTIVLVTHDLGAIAQMADHVVVLGGLQRRDSSVLYDGAPPPPAHLYDHIWHHGEDADPMERPSPGWVSE